MQKKEDIQLERSRVLIVDDVESNIKILAHILMKQGYKVAIATSGKQAISSAQKLPDLILLDVSMPEMDGFTVCEILKADEKTKNIPVIFLTALSDIGDMAKGFEVGAVDYITKPFNHTELLIRVKTHLQLKISTDIINEQNKELVELNGLLNDTLKKLEYINASKDKFFSIIAHDLKNPFSGLIGFTHFLATDIERMDKEDIKEMALGLHFSAERLHKLLDNLLNWARLQTGGMQYTPDTIPLREFTTDVISLLKDQANTKEIDLKLVIEDDLHFTADANMLRSALQNLISNAIKFTARGGKIEVCALFNETTILFSVEDSGVGIPQKVMDQLFDINHKYQMSGTDKEPGTGLGLILCKELIEKQGGSLTVESEVKKGSKFTILLPKRVESC